MPICPLFSIKIIQVTKFEERMLHEYLLILYKNDLLDR